MTSDNKSLALVLENVCKIRSSNGHQVGVLKNISLSLQQGRLSVFVGPSGGGKSTLLRLLNRLDDPTSGDIVYRGKPMNSISPVALRREISMVMQKPVMFEGTVQENVLKAFALRKEALPGADSALLEQTLQQCGLSLSLINRDAQSLSVGQQQRVSLARTLITGPEILLLDEPTSALDRPTGDLLAATLLNICRKRGLTIIMATHDLRLAEQIADHLVFIAQGKLVEQGKPDALLNNPKSAQLRKFLEEPDFSRMEASHD